MFMNKEKQQMTIALEPVEFALNGVNIQFDEESFKFFMISGNQARRYFVSPKHAKRVSLLLDKIIGEYEKKFGKKIETALPETNTQLNQGQGMGFHFENPKID